ncbi:phage holin family protein [Yeosuana marina]|uniref:phage holin family protein n=1 Tax=Yeosuana marina TaxID=1565536 RepID=UPI001423D172|nr:phage holin family protein [Yeosuana marina]
MKTLNFLFNGFGFENLNDFKISTFGYMIGTKVITWSLIIGIVESFFQNYFGIPLLVLGAFVLLNILEFNTGIAVSKKNKQIIQSRKMGRMFLKVGVYLTILFILQSFKMGLHFPKVMDYEIDPFILLYWSFLSGVIYQLFKSLLENLEGLGYQEATGILGYITRKFGTNFKNPE